MHLLSRWHWQNGDSTMDFHHFTSHLIYVNLPIPNEPGRSNLGHILGQGVIDPRTLTMTSAPHQMTPHSITPHSMTLALSEMTNFNQIHCIILLVKWIRGRYRNMLTTPSNGLDTTIWVSTPTGPQCVHPTMRTNMTALRSTLQVEKWRVCSSGSMIPLTILTSIFPRLWHLFGKGCIHPATTSTGRRRSRLVLIQNNMDTTRRPSARWRSFLMVYPRRFQSWRNVLFLSLLVTGCILSATWPSISVPILNMGIWLRRSQVSLLTLIVRVELVRWTHSCNGY